MKFNILKPALAALVLVGTACTANYLDINTNPYEPSEDDMQTDGYIIGSALTSLASTVVSTDVNTAQFTDVLLGGPMGGYYSTTGGFTRTIMNYNPTDDWTNVFMYSDRTIPVLYSNLRELKKVTDDPIVLAIADIIKVAAMHRVTDTYGPIPYSMIGENGQIQVHAFHHALCTVVKGDDLAVNSLIHALDVHNAVGCGDHGAALCGRGGGLVVLHTGLHHSQAGRIRRNGGQSALAGVVEHTVAHLQHIAGDQVRLHADGQLHPSGTVLLFQLGADALHGVLSRGTGTVQISL